MAKSRQQRKAERRARTQQSPAQAQQDTQQPRSAEVVEAEAVVEGQGAVEAPAPSRDDTVTRERDRAAKRDEAKAERKQKERKAKPAAKPAARRPATAEPRRRGRVASFFVSCWHELKRVQWPDRETLIQASAVTVLFVAVAAAYLGALDFVFNKFIQFIL